MARTEDEQNGPKMVAMEMGKAGGGGMSCFVTNRKNNKAFGRIVLARPQRTTKHFHLLCLF